MPYLTYKFIKQILKTLSVMFSEEDLSGSDKVYRAFPYIYVRVRVRVGLFSKIVKIKNLAMLDRILPHEILCNIKFSAYHQVPLIKLISFPLILKVHSHYLMLTQLFFGQEDLYY